MKGGVKLTTPTPRKTILKNPSLISVKNITNRTDLFKTHLLKDELDIFARVDGKDAMIIWKN